MFIAVWCSTLITDLAETQTKWRYQCCPVGAFIQDSRDVGEHQHQVRPRISVEL